MASSDRRRFCFGYCQSLDTGVFARIFFKGGGKYHEWEGQLFWRRLHSKQARTGSGYAASKEEKADLVNLDSCEAAN
jgi:hypothetical protein